MSDEAHIELHTSTVQFLTSTNLTQIMNKEHEGCQPRYAANLANTMTTSSPAGPRMLKSDWSSGARIAVKKAQLPSSAEAKVRCPGCWANAGANQKLNKSADRADAANRPKLFFSR